MSSAEVSNGSSEKRAVRRAILSVYDKTGLTELARGLADAGVELVSTGSTAKTIEAAGIPVTPVEQVTGFPECLDGRVKTLHPSIHAGLLADSRNPSHVEQLSGMGIEQFDLLVSNLYPFAATVAAGGTPDEIVEQIDIGGPAMVRSAAKNHATVAVVVSPALYSDVLDAVAAGGFTFDQRRSLAGEAFAHIADYDVAIANWFSSSYEKSNLSSDAASSSSYDQNKPEFPSFLGATWRKSTSLRYGENPHQDAALYWNVDGPTGLAQAEQLHGNELSYNNYVDADAARRAAFDFSDPCVAIIKHANPCGIALGTDIADAHAKANACDPQSAYGGVIAANRPITAAMATQVKPIHTEVVVAPDFDPEAVEILTAKKNRPRLLRCPAPDTSGGVDIRSVTGGLLLQEADRVHAPGDDPATWTLVAGKAASPSELADLAFAWRAIRSVKSNAILLASDGATVGVGMGQVNRVDSSRLAVSRAGDRVAGSLGASDAYFPFPDGLEVLIEAGVRAVVSPGGSIRDGEVIEAAEAGGIALYFTGTRHFFH